MQKNLPWLVSALLGATIASIMTWQVIQKPTPLNYESASPLTQQPLSFASAIQKSAPAVVNFYSTDAPKEHTEIENLPGSSGLNSRAHKKNQSCEPRQWCHS